MTIQKHKPVYTVKRCVKTKGVYYVIVSGLPMVVIKKTRRGWKYQGSPYYRTLRDAVMSIISSYVLMVSMTQFEDVGEVLIEATKPAVWC